MTALPRQSIVSRGLVPRADLVGRPDRDDPAAVDRDRAVLEDYEGKRVARHERSYGRYQEILDLEHYLDVLERKPGALAGSKPLEQWRKLGRWPESYDRFWQALIERHGRQVGRRR